MKIARAKGTKDIFGKDIKSWQIIEKKVREICKKHNIGEIRTPVFESTELYQRGVGDETDIVNKEMYTFLDKGGRSITLRPELTAGVVRSYIENGMGSLYSPQKFWYIANMYRYEKMQKGRYREFSQFGIEMFGSESYLADVEAICVSNELMKELNLRDKVSLNINSIGCSSCRKKYLEKLKEYVRPNIDSMCDSCRVRFERNPMRMLDCKEEKCKEILKDAPVITECLCDECRKEFEAVKNALEKIGIKYNVDTSIVRGLDYYNGLVYEWTSNDLDLAVGGGGRYDTLVEKLGGAHTPAVGFGIGMDRLVLLLEQYNLVDSVDKSVDFYIATFDENSAIYVDNIANELRKKGYVVDCNITKKNLKNQFKYADKICAKWTIVVGEEEINKGTCNLKNMESGVQVECKLDVEEIIKNI